MKIVIAPDKFKGSLTGIEFCNIVEKGIKKFHPTADLIKLPLADGGDGTVEALQFYLGGKFVSVDVHDPLMRAIHADYLYAEEKKVAFIEMAEASGIRLLADNERNPLKTNTYGTGELIYHAIKKGAQQIILGIGGSSTNDAGLGMARALGYRFFDKAGNELLGNGADLSKLFTVDASTVIPALKNVAFKVACDVENPLYGKNGAAHVYAPQKGATPNIVKELDMGLQHFNSIVKQHFNTNLQTLKGSGAAGGLGAGSKLFLNAELQSGISLVKQIANFKHSIENADWIITGEGKMDEQTFSGKVIQGIIQEVSQQKIAVFCGVSEVDNHVLQKHGIAYIDQIASKAQNIKDSISHADKYLLEASESFAQQL